MMTGSQVTTTKNVVGDFTKQECPGNKQECPGNTVFLQTHSGTVQVLCVVQMKTLTACFVVTIINRNIFRSKEERLFLYQTVFPLAPSSH